MSVHKKRRTGRSPGEEEKRNSQSDLVNLIEQSRIGTRQPCAFSPTANLVALASPRQPLSASDSTFLNDLNVTPAALPLSINLTYLNAATPTAIPRVSFTLQIPFVSSLPSHPTSSSTRQIKLLSFSPDGSNLLCISGADDAEGSTEDDYLTVFEQAESGCIDQWAVVLHEDVARFGARGSGSTHQASEREGKEVISVRWLGEPRNWFVDPEYSSEGSEGTSAKRNPLYCAPPRSSPLSGSAFVAVLSSDEVMFVHLPRTTPILPNIVCMPLHPPPSALLSPPSANASLPDVVPLSPSQRVLSLTAVPTPPTAVPTLLESTLASIGVVPAANVNVQPGPANHATPTSSISQLVGSLVSNLPIGLDSSLPLAIAPSPAAGAGNAALKEELKAAELANTIEGENSSGNGRRKRRVHQAEVGAVRGSRTTAEAGETTFLVATVSRRCRSCPRPNPTTTQSAVVEGTSSDATEPKQEASTSTVPVPDIPMLADLGINMNLDEENFDMNNLDGFDFGSLDAAFGSVPAPSPAPPPPTSKSPKKEESTNDGQDAGMTAIEKEWEEWERENGQGDDDPDGKDRWSIELSEVKIEMANAEGPRLTVRPQPHFFASPPTFADDGPESPEDVALDGKISHLAFLEDENVVRPDSSPSAGSEEAVALRLLVGSTGAGLRPRSSLSTYALSRESYSLSDAFSHLECKRSDVSTVDLGEWTARFDSTTTLPKSTVLTALAARPFGRELGTILAVVAELEESDEYRMNEDKRDDSVKSKVVTLNSRSLLMTSTARETLLPERDLFTTLLVSPNAAIVVALPSPPSASSPRPAICASPCIDADSSVRGLSTRLAISLVRQGDASDIIGLIASRKRDPAEVAEILENTHSILQAQLPPSKQLHNTSVQFSLLGIASTVYSACSPLSEHVRERVTTAGGLVESAAAARAFIKSEKRQRGVDKSVGGGYRCETDALWPLVGHASWYANFVENLNRELLRGSSSTEVSSPLLLHLLHPVARSLHLRLTQSILGLASSLTALALAPEPGMIVGEQEMVELAGKVLEDTVKGGLSDGGLQKWKGVLDNAAGIEGIAANGFPSTTSLTTLIVPESLQSQANLLLSHLRETYPSFVPNASDSLPSPPRSPIPSSSWDIIRRCQLPCSSSTIDSSRYGQQPTTTVLMKQCLRCGRKSGAVNSDGGSGVWAEFEDGWRSRCACGGLWKSA